MSTYHWELLAAIGGPALGILLTMWAFNRLLRGWAGTPVEAPVYARHRDDGIRRAMDAATLDRARGDRLIVLPNGGVEIERGTGQERTEEMPVLAAAEAVVHVEAAEEAPEEGAIGTVAAEESPEMADAAWRHEHDQRWTALLVGWASRPDWLADFGADSLQLPEYRRLVLEHTGEISMAELLAEAGTR